MRSTEQLLGNPDIEPSSDVIAKALGERTTLILSISMNLQTTIFNWNGIITRTARRG